jgi:flavin-dependent dehydrogenase
LVAVAFFWTAAALLLLQAPEARSARSESGGRAAALQPFVIDATGRHAAYARSHGARVQIDDHLTGLVAIFEGSTDSQTSTLVEAVEDGWWYSAHLPANRTVVAFMTDADIVRDGQLHEKETWLLRLGETGPAKQRIADANLVHGPVAAPAHSQILDPITGEGWVAAGEAAVGFDPLSSMGIGYAIATGIQAARVAASALGGNTDHAKLYAADIAEHYRAYLSRRQAYYSLERRWPQSPFWLRRTPM